eukprot:14124-Eustigmatos_ZCMA.PRE.1
MSSYSPFTHYMLGEGLSCVKGDVHLGKGGAERSGSSLLICAPLGRCRSTTRHAGHDERVN